MYIAVLLVDDHVLMRRGLRLLVEEEQGMHVVGEAGDGGEAVSLAEKLSPDVVVMDITMPGLSGIEATRRIISSRPQTKVVALSIHAGKRFVEGMLQAGAAGYILKKSTSEELIKAVRTVVQGEVYLSPSITGVVVSQYVEILSDGPTPSSEVKLSRSEREMLRLMVSGCSAEETASVLQVGVQTVETSWRQLTEKLGVENTAELAEVARQEGVVGRTETQASTGDRPASFALAGDVDRLPLTPDSRAQASQLLTQRELEVLELVAEGLSNKEIAARISRSIETVKKHIYNTYQKLDADSRVTALVRARDLGILPRS